MGTGLMKAGRTCDHSQNISPDWSTLFQCIGYTFSSALMTSMMIFFYLNWQKYLILGRKCIEICHKIPIKSQLQAVLRGAKLCSNIMNSTVEHDISTAIPFHSTFNHFLLSLTHTENGCDFPLQDRQRCSQCSRMPLHVLGGSIFLAETSIFPAV